MIIESAYFSEQGPRSYNQDRVLMPVARHDGSVIAAIADGVGGQAGGDIAAQIAIDITSKYSGSVENINNLFDHISDEIGRKAIGSFDRMATTLTVAIISSNIISVAHVGDARLYQIRGRGLKTLTEDQTELAELIKRGVLTPYQARRYRRKNVLTSALSSARNHEVFRQESLSEKGDYLLFLTDGSHQKILKKQIAVHMAKMNAMEEKLSDIRSEIQRQLPSDNYTALLIRI